MNDTLDDFSWKGVHATLCLLASNAANYQRNTTRWRVIDVKRSFPPLRQKREGALNKRARNSKSLRNDGLQTLCPGYDEHRVLQRIDHGHHRLVNGRLVHNVLMNSSCVHPVQPVDRTQKGRRVRKKRRHTGITKRQKWLSENATKNTWNG